jgi:hypothetical protein
VKTDPKHVIPLPVATGKPSTAVFIILLITLWGLNLADTFQTIYLATSGMLQQEANYFINFFLLKGPATLFLVKILALILITSMLIRAWVDKRGLKIFGIQYTLNQVRATVQFMLTAGAIYYILIVFFPFFALWISGSFSP